MTTAALKMATTSSAACLSVSEVMERVSQELRRHARVVEDLEALIGNLVVAGAFGSSTSLFQLQKLDRMRQELAGIADFTETVGRASSPHWTIDAGHAAQSLTLSELADRLLALRDELSDDAAAAQADCEFFEDTVIGA